jgi:hypothetical protein
MATTGNRCILHCQPGLPCELTHVVVYQQRRAYGNTLDEFAPLFSLPVYLARPGVFLHAPILPSPR